MDPEQLRKEIDSGDMRPSRIQLKRGEISRLLEIDIPRKPSRIENWWTNNKSVVSRRVNELLDEESNNDEEVEEVEEVEDESSGDD